MKTALVFSTKPFQNVGEYVAKYRHLDESLPWDSIKKWSELAEMLEVDITKWYNHARRALDKESEILGGATFKPKAQPINSTQSVSIPVTPKTAVMQPKQPVNVAPVAPVIETPVKPTASPVEVVTPTNADDVAKGMADALRALMFPGQKQELDENKVAEIVEERLLPYAKRINDLVDEISDFVQQTPVSKTLNISINNGPVKQVAGVVHSEFKNILTHVAIRDNVMLVGPAGSGKTTVCEQVAETLDLPFYCKSVCAQTSKAELLGFIDANGNYIITEFRKAYEFGGVFVLDEVDAGNPNVLAVLNSALSNSVCSFADLMVKKHENFVLIACANTFGFGSDRQYVGRNQLDAATLDRFSVIEFNYDEALEIALSGNETLAKCVQEIRKELGNERVVVSPRASIQGAKLLAAGMDPMHVFKTRIAKGMPANLEQRALIVFKRYFK